MLLHKDENGIYTKNEAETISYPDSGNEDCFAMEKDSFWFNHRNNVIAEIIKKNRFQGNFADVGGGNGYQSQFIKGLLPEREVFLIEPGYQGCVNALKYGLTNVYNIFFQDFDFRANNIGGIGLFDVVEHIEDDVFFLRQLSACAIKGTKIYMTVPAHRILWSDNDDHAGHYRRYNLAMIRELAKKAGLKLLYNGYFMSYLPLPILLGRSIPYRIRGKREESVLLQNSKSNHRQGKISRSAVGLLNSSELWAIQKLGALRFGGSCICTFET